MAAQSEPKVVTDPGAVSVVVASFASRHLAEHMVASLGHGFRHKARHGVANASVVTRGPDGSFTLAQSRVISASGVVARAMTFTAEIMVGLMGIGVTIRGRKAARHRAQQRQTGVGRESHQLAELFDQLGPHGACLIFLCTDEQTTQAVAKRADERGDRSSQHSRIEFLTLLDRLGGDYDWIRPAVERPVAKAKKRHP
jgi:hypothetical protein